MSGARPHPSYWKVFATFARNSLVRELSMRTNFLLECVVSISWATMYIGFYYLLYMKVDKIATWDKYQFFVFLATTHYVNSLVQAFFMPNVDEFSERIRTGALDFALVKPIDTQFLISLEKIQWSSLSNVLLATVLLTYGLVSIGYVPGPLQLVLYPLYVVFGVAIMYSFMITLGALSIWMVRNQSLYDFWFYITNFSRYPMEIYAGPYGTPLRLLFTFAIPILIVSNVPAHIMTRPMDEWTLVPYGILATAFALAASRWVFRRALLSYRSASS